MTEMNEAKLYVGFRTPGTGASVNVVEGIRSRTLDLRPDIDAAAAQSFEWGYHGSGPRRLAFAILADHLSSDGAALDLATRFSIEVLAGLNQSGFQLTDGEIAKWVATTNTVV